MPEGRASPYKYFPRQGADLTITFGEPVSEADLRAALETQLSQQDHVDHLPLTDQRVADERNRKASVLSGWVGRPEALTHDGRGAAPCEEHEVARIRSAVTAVLQRDVEALGHKVLGLVGN